MAKRSKNTTRTGAGTKRKTSSKVATKTEKTTEIVFSYPEIDFLRKITKKQVGSASIRAREARLALRDKLLDMISRTEAQNGGLIVLTVNRPEVDFLQRVTKEEYSFITHEERHARLILREKILIAVEQVTGKRLQAEKTV